jgi:Uma2 family endonuclease
MPTVTLKRPRLRASHLEIGPDSAGILLKPAEFDRAEFVEGWRYELINGVLVVSPIPLEAERDPNEELGYWLRHYQETHPEGNILDKTLSEHTVVTGENRRRVDRILWIGLGRLPTSEDVASILVEFVSKGKRSWRRDYVEKRDEYMALGVKEYWIIDRFERTLTVYTRQGKRIKTRVVGETDTYTTPLLPGFQLPLGRLLGLADEWRQ